MFRVSQLISRRLRRLITACVCALLLLCGTSVALAQTTSDLQAQIDDRTQKINQLEQDIAQLQQKLNDVASTKQTLQSTLNTLSLSKQKITAQINLTETQISRTNLQLQTLSMSIATTSQSIGEAEAGIATTMRDMNEADIEPLALSLISDGSLASAFDELAALAATRDGLHTHITNLANQKTTLETSKQTSQAKHDELAMLESNLAGQKKALEASIASQNQLLAQTKNQESNYQALIAQKKSQEAQFEQELEQFQSQLKNTVDVSTLPHPGTGVLAWPFSATYMENCASRLQELGNNECITQYFGNTPFATQNPQVYNGHGHDGIDIAAPIGTPVLSVARGVVMGLGNTDLTCLGASYGKWILIKHDNGLATLYAHLSVQSVTTGEEVAQGGVIGYSGFTGYATGPHLHLTVFAADAVQISSFPSRGCPGAIYTMPVSPLQGYLNPLSYL